MPFFPTSVPGGVHHLFISVFRRTGTLLWQSSPAGPNPEQSPAASAPAVQGLIQFPHKGAQISAPQADGVFIPLPIAPGKAGTAASADLEDCVTQAAQSRRGTAPPRKGSHPPPQPDHRPAGQTVPPPYGRGGSSGPDSPPAGAPPAGRLKGLGGKQIGDPPVLAQHPIQIAQGPGRRRAAPPARPPGTSVRREA